MELKKQTINSEQTKQNQTDRQIEQTDSYQGRRSLKMGKASAGYQRHRFAVIRWTSHGDVTHSTGNADNSSVSTCMTTDRK